MIRSLAAGCVIGLALTGCAGSSTAARPPEKTAPESTAATEATATTAQYASLIAAHKADITRTGNTLRGCGLYARVSPICRIGFSSLSLEAQTIDVLMDGTSTIGAPPAEIVQLVADTRETAQKAMTAADAASACKRGCAGKTGLGTIAASDLVDQLDAWAPYM